MKILVSRNELLAALLFASTDENRYVLAGVQIEARPHKPPIIVATDGRRLVCIETVAEQAETENSHTLLLRADFILPICGLSKALGGKMFPWIAFENVPGSQRVRVELFGADFYAETEKGALIEGQFPNWRQCLPSTEKHERQPITDLGMNSEFMGDFAKAAKLLECKSPIVQMNLVGKQQQVEVKLMGASNFYGLIMPCEVNEAVDYQPEFVAVVEACAAAHKSEQEKFEDSRAAELAAEPPPPAKKKVAKRKAKK